MRKEAIKMEESISQRGKKDGGQTPQAANKPFGGTAPLDEANRKYRDTVFNILFSDEKHLLELYKVLHPEDRNVGIEDIRKITLENVVLFRRYNDAAMSVKDRLIILTEHQSRYNPNMPIRLLIYVASEYEKMLKGDRRLYGSRLIQLPAPEFYVIYTGAKGKYEKSEIFHIPLVRDGTLRIPQSMEAKCA